LKAFNTPVKVKLFKPPGKAGGLPILITTTTQLIKRLKTDSNPRLLCGFEKVPGRSTFSRNFTELSEMNIMSETLDRLVKEAYEGKVVYHVSCDSAAIEAREAQKGGNSPSKAGNGH
jgi:transposase